MGTLHQYSMLNGYKPTYDANGNMTQDGQYHYTWDAENRLVAISLLYPGVGNPAKSWDFAYDGFGRRVDEKYILGATLAQETRYVWAGSDLVEARGTDGSVWKRYFSTGMQILSPTAQAGVYYYTRDHLGSIRELTDATGAVRAEYDYDPWGRRTKLSGDLDADFGFTGDFEHASGLKLTWFREYNPDLGRWLTRDPLGIRGGGVNLYAYVDDSPVDWRDPLGLCGNNYGNGGAAGGPGGSWGGSNDNASQNASTMLPSSGGITAQAGGLAGVAPLGGEYAGIAGFAGYFLNSGWGIAMPQPTAGDTGRATTGAYAGAGGGLFISSATTPDQLEAMDNQLSLGAGLLFDGVTVTIAWGPNGWYIAVYPLGPGGGAYISYTTGCDSNR